MAARYVVTGAQLALIAGLAKTKETEAIQELVHGIQSTQYIEESNYTIDEDIKRFTLSMSFLDIPRSGDGAGDQSEEHS